MSKQPIGVIGDGLMASHFCNYLNYEGCDFIQWSRREEKPLSILKNCDTIFILIKDSSIKEFINSNPELQRKNLIHFSGALEIDGINGFHPLMTFSKKLYPHSVYKEIPFIGSKSEEIFRKLLPWSENRYYSINPDQKALYHSLCVISGNFTSILWQKVFKEFQSNLGIPGSALLPYLTKTLENIKDDPFNSLTGPIKRDDRMTIRRNIASLDRIWGKIYRLFRKAYQKEIK